MRFLWILPSPRVSLHCKCFHRVSGPDSQFLNFGCVGNQKLFFHINSWWSTVQGRICRQFSSLLARDTCWYRYTLQLNSWWSTVQGRICRQFSSLLARDTCWYRYTLQTNIIAQVPEQGQLTIVVLAFLAFVFHPVISYSTKCNNSQHVPGGSLRAGQWANWPAVNEI